MSEIDWVVVPSVWWENSPLVIQEAFMQRRPVICSDIGGMAEKVTDGVDGLHFRAGDPQSLADTIERAVGTPGLWDRLRAGIGEVHPLGRHVANLTDLYDEQFYRMWLFYLAGAEQSVLLHQRGDVPDRIFRRTAHIWRPSG